MHYSRLVARLLNEQPTYKFDVQDSCFDGFRMRLSNKEDGHLHPDQSSVKIPLQTTEFALPQRTT